MLATVGKKFTKTTKGSPEIDRRFRGAHCFRQQGILMMVLPGYTDDGLTRVPRRWSFQSTLQMVLSWFPEDGLTRVP
jgi:hypothetical protein